MESNLNALPPQTPTGEVDSVGCAPMPGSAGVRQRGNLYWIIQALRPNIEIRITTDWEPNYRLRRFLRKGNCEICGRRFREMEEGTISKRETLCGIHCMMTTQEIADHHGQNVQELATPLTGDYDTETKS